MTIPISTTTIRVEQSSQDGTKDLYDTLTFTTLASGVRAVIGAPGGSETVDAGSREEVVFRLDCDPVASMRHDDRVVDEASGITYEVIWVEQRGGLGLDHTVAELRLITDRVSS